MTQKSLERNIMPNKHFCQGPECHQKTTQDRFLKSRGVVRGRYAMWNMNESNGYSPRCKYFCSTRCESEWLDVHLPNIEQGRPIEFIRHRRESGGYQKVTTTHDSWNGGTYNTNTIERVDRTIE
jgi:hypothetical protein